MYKPLAFSLVRTVLHMVLMGNKTGIAAKTGEKQDYNQAKQY